MARNDRKKRREPSRPAGGRTSPFRSSPGPRRGFGVALSASAALSLLVAGCGGGGPSGGPGETLEAGISRTLARARADALSDLRYRYRLSVPRSRAEPVTGTLELRFRRSDPEGGPVVLDFKDPEERVGEVRVGGELVEPAYRFDHVVLPAWAFPEAGEEVRVEVTFTAGDEALNRNDDFLYTLFVPDRAHFSLPLFDQPDLKGRFSLELEIPGGWEALANGAEVERERREGTAGAGNGASVDADEGRLLLRYAETEPIPTYLFAFAAGDFQVERAVRDGRELTFLHREADSARVARNRQEIFDLHATALEWLEEYTGIPYPFGEFGFVAVPSFQYGGMEHPGAVFYRAGSLFLDASATQGQHLGRASVIAHETAHMWFGDLVTMEWFDDVWMKEVFANYMAAQIVHPSFPEIDHDLRFFLSHHPSAYGVDRTGGANPIRQELQNLQEAGTLYGAIIYQKAPVVMRQLALLVGEDTFREGLRKYLRDHAYGNATWPDLIRILDRLSPRDLGAWSRVWVGEAGRPRLRAAWEDDGEGRVASLHLTQRDPGGRGRHWPQVVHVALGYGPDSVVVFPVELLEGEVEVEGARGLPAPEFVLPGARGTAYGRIDLDARSREVLARRLPDLVDDRTRAAGWIALWDELLEGEVAPVDHLELLLRGIRAEEEDLILERLVSNLDVTWWRLLLPGERRARAEEVEGLLWEEILTSQSRRRTASLFRSFRDVAITPDALALLREIWTGSREVPDLPLSERDRTGLAATLALREVEGWEGILDRQAEAIEDPDRRKRFAFVRPSLSADPAEREAFFASLADPENRSREPWVIEGLGYLHHPLRAEHARRFVEPSLELLPEIQRTGDIFFPKRWLDATLGGHASPEVAETVRAFLEDRPDLPPRLRGKVLQSADLLFRAAEFSHARQERLAPALRGEGGAPPFSGGDGGADPPGARDDP